MSKNFHIFKIFTGDDGKLYYPLDSGEVVRVYFRENDEGSLFPFIRKPKKKPIPERLRWEVWERDNFTCQRCGSRKYLEVDHIIPESRGGQMTAENLQTLCRTCNRKKGNRA